MLVFILTLFQTFPAVSYAEEEFPYSVFRCGDRPGDISEDYITMENRDTGKKDTYHWPNRTSYKTICKQITKLAQNVGVFAKLVNDQTLVLSVKAVTVFPRFDGFATYAAPNICVSLEELGISKVGPELFQNFSAKKRLEYLNWNWYKHVEQGHIAVHHASSQEGLHILGIWEKSCVVGISNRYKIGSLYQRIKNNFTEYRQFGPHN